MRPTLPDTPVFRALSGLSRDELEAEIHVAQRLATAAQTYLEWLRLTLQTTSAFESIAAAHRENGAAADEASRPEAIPGVYPYAVGIPAVTMVKPALRRAILMILTEEPRRWRKRELYEELEHRGWLPEGKTPDKQITNRLTEMARRGEIKRHGPGVVSAALEDLDRGTRLGDEK